MTRTRTVEQGDCLIAIADEEGFFWETLWDLPENAALQKRPGPGELMRGDVVTVPPLREKTLEVQSGARHSFRRRGIPAVLRMVLKLDGKLLSGKRYRLRAGRATFEDTTGGDAVLMHPVATDVQRVFLEVWLEDAPSHRKHLFVLDVGQLEPIESLPGVKGRLKNLGYECGRLDAPPDEKLAASLRAFQERAGLQATGELDDETRRAIGRAHEGGNE